MSRWSAREALRRAIVYAHQAAREVAAREPAVSELIRRCADALAACAEFLRDGGDD